MGLGKITGEYIEEMTEPNGWPDIDEDALRQRANTLIALRNQVNAASISWTTQHKAIFDGGVWAGRGAEAGSSSVQESISQMSFLEIHLAKSFAYYNSLAQTIAATKTLINQNLQNAQQMIQAIRSTPGLDEASKEDLVKGYVLSQHAVNTAEVLAMAGDVTMFSTWQAPSKAIPPPSAPAPPSTSGHEATPPTPTVTMQTMGTRSPVNPRPNPAVATPSQQSINTVDAPRDTTPRPAPPVGAVPGTSDPASSGSSAGGLSTSSSAVPSPSTSTGTSTPSSGGGTLPSTSTSGSPASVGHSSPAATSTGSGPSAGVGQGSAGSASTTGASNTTSAGKAGSFQPMTSQAPPPLSSPAPASSLAPTAAPVNQAAASAAPPSGGAAGAASGTALSSGGSAGPAPVGAAPTGAPSSPPPMPLAPPTTPQPPGPPAPGTAPAASGPGVAPMSAASSASASTAAPVPVSTARAERDAIAAATAAGAVRRNANGADPLQRARHIAAALNVGIVDFGFFWVTGVTTDGTIVVANSYGLAYIPDGVHLPDHVKMASADEAISLLERASWATYPILAVQRWAQHHDKTLRAVVATEEQFATFDPGVAKVILTAEDIPDSGKMKGRNRLEVIAPAAAQRLADVSDTRLTDLLPPAPTDQEAPADDTARLWFEVAKPLMSTSSERGAAHLQAFVAYAEHAQTHALHRAHTAVDADTQRHAMSDWVYWQHLAVLISDAISASASA